MSQVTQLEQQKSDFKAAIEKRGMASRLMKNRDFRKLILEEFCTAECARYVQASADPNLSKDEQADALALAQAAGHIRRYLNVVDQMGNHAENMMGHLDDAIDEARLEEAELDLAPVEDSGED